MKRWLLIALLFCQALCGAKKPVAPDWTDAVKRETLFPAATFYTGFVSTRPQAGEDKSQAYERAKEMARAEAVSTIQVTVEQTIERQIESQQTNADGVNTRDILNAMTQVKTGIKDIPGLNVEVWEDTKKGDIYAIAYVRRIELANKLSHRVATNIQRADAELTSIESFFNSGDKLQARANMAKVAEILADIEADQKVLLSIQNSVKKESLSLDESQRVTGRYRAMESKLRHGIYIYLDCKTDNFGKPYTAMAGKMKGALAELGCTFKDNAAEADWIITVNAEVREGNTTPSYGTYFTYVDADVSVKQRGTNQVVYEDRFSQKGGDTRGYKEAANEAYRRLTTTISDTVKKVISEQK